MTSRQIWEYALVELNKVQAPSLLLEDYNYFINKAVNQYINKIYNAYEVNQQKSDDLRVLKGTTILQCLPQDDYNAAGLGNGITGTNSTSSVSSSPLFGATYETYLPDDYLHVLNCIAEFKVKKNFKCYNTNDIMHFGVKKLTSDMFSQIINNYYMRPSYKSPYFFINNVNTSNTFPVQNQVQSVNINISNVVYTLKNKDGATGFTEGTTATINGVTFIFKNSPNVDNELEVQLYSGFPGINIYNLYQKLVDCSNSNITKLEKSINSVGSAPTAIYTIYLFPPNNEAVNYTVGSLFETGITTYLSTNAEKLQKVRYGNRSKVRMEIRYGKDNTLFELQRVYVDYLKAPQFIRLTQTQVDEVEDNSQLIEFPDYVCQEIVNELTKLLMENGSDPRLQTNIPINQSIAQPQQEQQPKR